MTGLISGIMGFLDGGAAGNARDIQEQMLAEARNIPLPILKEYYPELYKQVVTLNPEMETAVTLGPSEMQGISTDPALRQAQMNALMKLQGIGEAGGRDAQFMSDAARLENDVNTNLQGQQGAISQNMAARGMSGGGSELVAKQIAAQQAANRQAQMGMDLKAQAERRALDAIIQGGQLGGQMQNQDFNQQAQKAQAADAINRFNTQNRQQVLSNNVASKNRAQEYNANNAQDVSNKNVGLNNQAQQYNQNLSQQQFDNEMKKRGLITGAQQGLANSYMNESQGNKQFMGGLIATGAKAFGKGG